VDVDRLRCSDPAVWLTPAERVAIVELVDQAREAWAVDRDASVLLDWLAPVARFPARLIEDRADAVALTERLVVSYRRSVAGWRLAVAQHRPGAEIAAEYRLSHVCPADEDGTTWVAAGRIDAAVERV
jgi:hypothetical protein